MSYFHGYNEPKGIRGFGNGYGFYSSRSGEMYALRHLCRSLSGGYRDGGENGPQVIRDLCVSCGQCVAVCPHGALDNANAPLDTQVARDRATDIREEAAAQFLRSRRSVRNYRSQAVPRETIRKVLDIAPPGAYGLQFTRRRLPCGG